MVRVNSTILFSILALCCIIFSSQVSVIAQESTDTDDNEEYLVKFTRVEPELVPKEKGDPAESLNWNSYGPGTSVADFDNDGDMDLYISARFSHLEWQDTQNSLSVMTTFGTQLLFENKGNFTFKDVTNKSGIINDIDGDGVSDSTSVSGVWGDYNSDGFLDLYVSEFGHTNGKYAGGKSNVLYHNNGNGTFTDVTDIAGVGNRGHSSVAQWVDYDHDGDLDLYSLNYGTYFESENDAEAETNILYQNNGDGTFTDVTFSAKLSGSIAFSEIPGEHLESGVVRVDMVAGTPSSPGMYSDSDAGSGMSWAALWIDYDNDGWEDVFIASDFGISPMYRNNGDGTFSVVTNVVGMNFTGTGMGLDAGDYDRDGDLDICQSNIGPNYLWQKQDDGTYKEVGDDVGLNVAEAFPVHWVCDFFDYDLDGDLDLFFSVGQISAYNSRQDNTFWINDGEGKFTEMAFELNLLPTNTEKTQGASIVDFDNDGDLDIVTGNSNAPIRVFENHADLTGRHWLMIDLEGRESNIQGIGAEVVVWVGDQPYVQQKFACSGSFGCSDERLHFGLDDATLVDAIVVNWPSGKTTELYDVSVDQVILISEYAPETPDLVPFGILVLVSFILFVWRHYRT